MRIIAGKYRGRTLKSPPSLRTRPTSDRLRETLFNILTPRIAGARFLDLCSGSGAVGIEALSRGAAHATFVDQARNMCGLIEANLDGLEIPEADSEVVCSEATEFLRRAGKRSGHQAWNVIFFDPPYSSEYDPALDLVGAGSLLKRDGLLVVEHFHKHQLSEHFGGLQRYRVLKQGDSVLSFFVHERLPSV